MDSVPRLHEYEYTHSYSTGARFQPHKITLIVKNGEARVLYKSADFTATSSPENSLRQGNRYQAAMTMDLGADYSGGRVGLMTYAHQLNVTSFKITDISDDSNLPTDYCGGDKGTYCDAGVSGLCLAVAANDVCEGAVGGVDVDMATLDAFTFVEDPYLRENCSWTIGSRGVLRQNSNAARALGDWVAFGCNAIVEDQELTDFVVEATMDHDDNDGTKESIIKVTDVETRRRLQLWLEVRRRPLPCPQDQRHMADAGGRLRHGSAPETRAPRRRRPVPRAPRGDQHDQQL